MNYNLQDEDMFYQSQQDFVTLNKSEYFGYPNLGHPTNHFNITPFEAVYADVHSWDHIKMQETIDEYDDIGTIELYRLGNFIVKEVEDKIVHLQNKIIGQNHKLDPNYEYKAWYKARESVIFGNHITPKTDPGDYIIESTGNITAYAPLSVELKTGFHAKAGSTFHGYIDEHICVKSQSNTNNTNDNNFVVERLKTDLKTEQTTLKNNTDKILKTELDIKLYPNPNNGSFTFKTNTLNNILYIYSLDGKLHHQQNITTGTTRLNLNLDKGLYIVVYKNKTLKLIIQ